MVRLLIIGFDAMAHAMSKAPEGLILKKQSVVHAHTGISWTSFYTGMLKEQHGVTDKWGRPEGGSKIFNDIRHLTFMDKISKAGHKVYYCNLPTTPEGFPFFEKPLTDLINRYKAEVNRGAIYWAAAIRNAGIDKIVALVRGDSFEMIEADKIKESDLAFIQFSFLDRIGHCFTFESDEVINKSYALAYELIGHLIKLSNPEYVIVTSDHGFPRNTCGHEDYKEGSKDAVLMLNSSAAEFFKEYDVVRQIDIHNKILRMFDVSCQ